eukprot:IDg16749t1
MSSLNDTILSLLHHILSNGVVYVEEVLARYNKLEFEAGRPTVSDVDQLQEKLAPHHVRFAKSGFIVRTCFDPLGVRRGRSGVFLTVANTVKDDAVKLAAVLPRPRDAAFFAAVIDELLEEGDNTITSARLGRVLPVALLRNRTWLRAIKMTGEREQPLPPLLPRDVDRLLVQLDREHWLRLTKLRSRERTEADIDKDNRERFVWFGPRAIAELPAVARELRQREQCKADNIEPDTIRSPAGDSLNPTQKRPLENSLLPDASPSSTRKLASPSSYTPPYAECLGVRALVRTFPPAYTAVSTVLAGSHYTASTGAAAVDDRSMSCTIAHPSMPAVASNAPSHAGANTNAVIEPVSLRAVHILPIWSQHLPTPDTHFRTALPYAVASSARFVACCAQNCGHLVCHSSQVHIHCAHRCECLLYARLQHDWPR